MQSASGMVWRDRSTIRWSVSWTVPVRARTRAASASVSATSFGARSAIHISSQLAYCSRSSLGPFPAVDEERVRRRSANDR